MIFEAVLAVTAFGSNEFGFGFSTVYALLVLSLVIVGLAGDIRHTETFYRFVATVFGFITLLGFAAGVFLFTTFASDAFIVISVFATFFMYFLAALIHGQAVHVVGSMLQYLAMMPTYITVFTVYSFCHLNDISWGTKEGNSQSESRLKHLEFARKNADEAAELDKILENFITARISKTSNNHNLDEAIAQESKTVPPAASAPSTAPLTSVVVNGLQPTSPNLYSGGQKDKNAAEQEADSELGYAIVGRPPVGMGASVISAGTRQPHLAEDVKNSGETAFEDKMSEAGILVKMARRVLPGDQGDMIKEARKVLRAHRVAEKRALLQAKKLEVDKKEAVVEFNQFRMTMLGVWIGSNLLFLGIISNYNLLSSFALAASVLILYMGGVKLTASLLLAVSIRTKSCFQYCCRRRCYRADQLTGKLICCCSADDYYYIDELWEIEQDELHGTRFHERHAMTAGEILDEEHGTERSASYSLDDRTSFSQSSSPSASSTGDIGHYTPESSLSTPAGLVHDQALAATQIAVEVDEHDSPVYVDLDLQPVACSGNGSIASGIESFHTSHSAYSPVSALSSGIAETRTLSRRQPSKESNTSPNVVHDLQRLNHSKHSESKEDSRSGSLAQPAQTNNDWDAERNDCANSESGSEYVDVLDGIDLEL